MPGGASPPGTVSAFRVCVKRVRVGDVFFLVGIFFKINGFFFFLNIKKKRGEREIVSFTGKSP